MDNSDASISQTRSWKDVIDRRFIDHGFGMWQATAFVGGAGHWDSSVGEDMNSGNDGSEGMQLILTKVARARHDES